MRHGKTKCTWADKCTCCGLPPPLSLIDTAPLWVPTVVAVKWTLIVQDFPAPTLELQLFVWEKGPVIVMPVMLSVVLPTLVSVVVAGGGGQVLTLPTSHENCKLLGFSLTSVPVPLRETVWGLPGALSVISSLAVRVLMPVGLKVTLIVQLAPGATKLPQV